jgi:uncharacterized protein with FMN-binding domain
VSARSRILLWFLSTVTVVVLLFGYRTSTSGPTTAGGQKAISAQGSGSTGSGSSGTGSTSSGSASTVTGDVADTRWGPVQVQLTVASDRITDVSVVRYPDGNGRDQQINARALPILVQETLDAQSARIDMVSGATVTSDGYLRSLQSALDQAGL